MTVSFAGMNDAVLSAFGESVSFTVGLLTKTLTVVVIRPEAPITGRSMAQNALRPTAMGDRDLLVMAVTSALTTAGISVGDIAAIGGLTYRVAKLWPDDGGMTALEMRV